MSGDTKKLWTETLPEPLPDNPLAVVAKWLAQARQDAAQPNPDAMVLATADERGFPSARVVLCKEVDCRQGSVVFYSNYRSRKGRELEANRRAAVVFHWDHRHRQVRIEGRVEPTSEAQSDAYFESRAWQSRLGSWASEQSEPVASRQVLTSQVAAAAARFGIAYGGPGSPEPERIDVELPRPPHWGGYRLYADAVELWVEGEFRIHDRARWTRTLSDRPGVGASPPWRAVRLQP